MATMARKRSAKKEHMPQNEARWVLFMPTIPSRDDEQRIAAASPRLEGLYSHFSLKRRRKPNKAS
jgi:hypothetical protein